MISDNSTMKYKDWINNMPTKSKAQEKLMRAVANNPKFAKQVGIPVKVGKEFVKPKKK
jgi:hypothetical protein